MRSGNELQILAGHVSQTRFAVLVAVTNQYEVRVSASLNFDEASLAYRPDLIRFYRCSFSHIQPTFRVYRRISPLSCMRFNYRRRDVCA